MKITKLVHKAVCKWYLTEIAVGSVSDSNRWSTFSIRNTEPIQTHSGDKGILGNFCMSDFNCCKTALQKNVHMPLLNYNNP